VKDNFQILSVLPIEAVPMIWFYKHISSKLILGLSLLVSLGVQGRLPHD